MRASILAAGAAMLLALSTITFAEAESPAEAPPPVAPHEVTIGPEATDDAGRPGRVHEVVSGDTLWDISDAYLGTPWVWPSVWTSNEDIQNPHLIYPGDHIWVSPTEMRRLTDAEAAALLGGSPAALADGLEGAPEIFRYPEVHAVGYVTPHQMKGATSILDSHEERVYLAQHDRVIIGYGAGETEVGDEFDVISSDQLVRDPDTTLPIGHATTWLGWLEVEEVGPESSVAIVREAISEIRRDAHILPRQKTAEDIVVKQGPDVIGTVVHTGGDKFEMAEHDVVYLNRGIADGLEQGQSLEVFRPIGTEHDTARNDQERELPDRLVGKMIVLNAFPTTATAFITYSADEVGIGDRFRGSDSIWSGKSGY